MLHRTKLMLKAGFTSGLFFTAFLVQAETPVVIKKETSAYILDVKYPQGFKTDSVNTAIKSFIDSTQKAFMNELSEDEDTPADAPGKTGLNVTYSIPYKSDTALSVQFNVSIYHKGAAHPANTVAVVNFVKGQEVKLADLFVSGADYLKPISAFAKKAITAKKISDEQWISEGTKPTTENYAVWYFTDKGIAVLFNSYQVAAYVYGEQTINIPLSLISVMLKPEIAKSVWGN